jgi:hypothetical protein
MASVIGNETTYPMESDELFVEGEMLPPVVASVVAHVLEEEEEKPQRRRRRGCRGGRKRRGRRGAGRRYQEVAIQPPPMYEAYAYVCGDGNVRICSIDEVYDLYTGKWNGDPVTYVPLVHLGLTSAEVSQYLHDSQTLEDLEYKRDELSRDEEIFDKCTQCRAGGLCSYCRAETKEQARAHQDLTTEMAAVRARMARAFKTVQTAILSRSPSRGPYEGSRSDEHPGGSF